MKNSSNSGRADSPVLRLGVVGCGTIARCSHIPAAIQTPNVQVAYLCDTQLHQASLLKQEFGLAVPVTDSLDDLVGSVDAVVVGVPPRFHAPVSIQLMQKGINVLCEKPLAATVAEGREMVETAKQAGCVLAVGFQQRFHPNNALFRDILEAGWLGDIEEVVGEFGGAMDGFLSAPTYFSSATTAGGVLFDMGSHLVDRVTWLLGDLHDVSMEDDAWDGMEANAVVRGRLSVGERAVPCTLVFSWTHGLRNTILVRGKKATVELPTGDPMRVRFHSKMGGHQRLLMMETPEAQEPFRPPSAQMADFSTAVLEKRLPLVTGRSALRPLEIVEEAYKNRRRMEMPWMEPVT